MANKNKNADDRISIHAPHEGERLIATKTIIAIAVFQSTLPTRGSDSNLLVVDGSL